MFINYFRYRYPNLNLHIIIQKDNKAHGLNDYVMSKIEELEVDLIVAPDSSSNDVKQQNILLENGIDVLILDHHHIEDLDIIDKRVVLINNQAPNNVNKYISAVGVVYLFLELYNKIVFKDNYHEKFLDVVALGLIADSCDMRDVYTRKLTIQGLENTNNKFIQALIKEQEYKVKTVNIMSVAFYIAPLINACIRMCSIEDRELVFKALCFEENIDKAVDICSKAKSKQNRIRDKELAAIKEDINEEELDNLGAIIVVKNDITPSIIGLVANKLTDVYKKPAIVLRENNGKYTGSGRCFTDCFSFKDWLTKSELVIYALGHDSAQGVGVEIHNLPLLKDKSKELLEIVGQATTYIDREYKNGIVDFNDITEVIENEDLWGGKVSEPLFLISNLRLSDTDIHILGKKQNTIKFTYNNIDYLLFNADENIIKNFSEYNNFMLNAIVKFNKNIYNGKVTLQAIIEEFEIKECNNFFF